MKEFESKEFYERIDQLIKMRITGTPNEFAYKLGISESHLYRVLKNLKENAFCPIIFNKSINSYIYQYAGKLEVEFCYKVLDREDVQRINGGMAFLQNFFSLSKNESDANYFWFDKYFYKLKLV